ncbi:DUF2390 domain-containing protein [Paraferrimonas sedimenticola]|uniref:TIGR02444 family protein n=1 Tax=Paraferrimonas sedimenticola TaxID=375674 RepID=A0AA37RU24_9GAMM|nr:DUF2390 domain-containing protein [Paraferrimonas sedimenticola]GLP95780.1 hypothetical protein GCM10007895_10860 [Paraferrimonas sedimenticola]
MCNNKWKTYRHQPVNWPVVEAGYGVDGVAERLHQLQDKLGLDVNLCLLALSLDCGRSANRPVPWQDLVNAASGWRDLLGPIRQHRQLAKAGPKAQYQRLKAIELEYERLAQRRYSAIINQSQTPTQGANQTHCQHLLASLHLPDVDSELALEFLNQCLDLITHNPIDT